MTISPKYKFIFCHIPKTAGLSVANALRGYGLRSTTRDVFDAELGSHNQHVSMHQLKNSNLLTEEQFEEYFKFCFVRNPWSQLVSIYHYQQSVWFQKHRFNDWNFATSNNFIDWAMHSLPRGGTLQLPYIVDDSGNLLVDKVYRFENLVADFDEIRSKLNLPKPTNTRLIGDTTLYKFNESEHDHYTEYYNDEVKEMVASYAKEDIERFDYNFV